MYSFAVFQVSTHGRQKKSAMRLDTFHTMNWAYFLQYKLRLLSLLVGISYISIYFTGVLTGRCIRNSAPLYIHHSFGCQYIQRIAAYTALYVTRTVLAFLSKFPLLACSTLPTLLSHPRTQLLLTPLRPAFYSPPRIPSFNQASYLTFIRPTLSMTTTYHKLSQT